MKKIILFSLLFLISCGDEDIDITGNYDVYYLSIVNCFNINDNFFIDRVGGDCTRIAGQDVCFDAKMSFEGNTGTLTVITTQRGVSNTDMVDFTFEIDGNRMTLCETENDCWVGSLKLSEARFEFAGAGQQDGCSIILRGDRI